MRTAYHSAVQLTMDGNEIPLSPTAEPAPTIQLRIPESPKRTTFNLNRKKLVEIFSPNKEYTISVIYESLSGDSLFGITIHPTSNCQISSINNAVNFISYENALSILKTLWEFSKKGMILFDIPKGYCDRLEEIIPKDAIVTKTPYLSTRETFMCLYLVKSSYLFPSTDF